MNRIRGVKALAIASALLAIQCVVAQSSQPVNAASTHASIASHISHVNPMVAAAAQPALTPENHHAVAADISVLNQAREKPGETKLSAINQLVVKPAAPTASTSDLHLTPAMIDTSKLNVAGLSAHVFLYRGEGQAINLAPSAGMLDLREGDVVAFHSARPAVVTPRLGGGVIATSSTVLLASSQQQPVRQLALEYSTSDLAWVPAQMTFAGELVIGVVDVADPQAQDHLSATIPVQLIALPNALKPEELSIDHVGAPFAKVMVTADGSEDPLKVQFRSRFDSELPEAGLHLIKPRVAISAPKAIPGWGLGFTDITVRAEGMPFRDGESVTLDLDRGWMESATLVAKDGIVTGRLRSVGVGSATIRLVPGLYIADPRQVAFVQPWALLIATILGAMLGATVYVSLLRPKSSRAKRRPAGPWITSVFCAIGITAMAYAGFHLPERLNVPQATAGETFPFALTFLIAALGPKVLGWFALAKNLVKGKTKGR